MFTVHDVIEIAIKIEENGEASYRQVAVEMGQESNPGLASMLTWLADQEAEHVQWFTQLKAQVTPDGVSEELESMGQKMLRNVVGDQNFSLDDVDWSQVESLEKVLDIALELEYDTAMFYQTLAGFVTDETCIQHLETIIEEEKRHGRLLLEFQQSGDVPDYSAATETPG